MEVNSIQIIVNRIEFEMIRESIFQKRSSLIKELEDDRDASAPRRQTEEILLNCFTADVILNMLNSLASNFI